VRSTRPCTDKRVRLSPTGPLPAFEANMLEEGADRMAASSCGRTAANKVALGRLENLPHSGGLCPSSRVGSASIWCLYGGEPVWFPWGSLPMGDTPVSPHSGTGITPGKENSEKKGARRRQWGALAMEVLHPQQFRPMRWQVGLARVGPFSARCLCWAQSKCSGT
jgi:hypothetical protein